MNIYKLFITTLIPIVILSSCFIKTDEKLVDKSLLTNTPCSAPCWYGLEPGLSSESQTLTAIEKFKFIDQKSLFIHEMTMKGLISGEWGPGKEITADCVVGNQGNKCLTLRTVDQKLRDIEFITNYKLSLSNVVDNMGKPEFVGYQNLGAEKFTCRIGAIWKNKGLILYSGELMGNKGIAECIRVSTDGSIEEAMIIKVVKYVTELEINRLLEIEKFHGFSKIIPDS